MQPRGAERHDAYGHEVHGDVGHAVTKASDTVRQWARSMAIRHVRVQGRGEVGVCHH
jgi:hypothetical protein